MKPLRWHGWVRTTNGHVTSYVRVRAWTAEAAMAKMPRKAMERWRERTTKADRKMTPHPIEDWIVIGVQLHEDDQNRLHEAPKKTEINIEYR